MGAGGNPAGSAGASISVVDLGTNTTRLLVCEVSGGQVAELERRTRITRLGEGVDATGALAEGAKNRVRETLGAYRELIDHHGPDRTVAVATSAMRDARDGEAFLHELAERFGLEARTIEGREEARLTFLGATAQLAADPATDATDTLVLDIGGGSTEFVVGRPASRPTFDVSAKVGSVRQTERHVSDDPPNPESLHALAEEVRQTIADEVPAEVRAAVETGTAVAGTATSLAAISQELDPYDPARVHGFDLDRGEVERILAMLAALPLDERREVTGLHPDRAPTIVAGAVILLEAMRAFDLGSVRVSEADILHGAALDAVAGAA